MTRYGFLFDPTRCFGCQGCVAACVNANSTAVHWRRVHKLPPEQRSSATTYLSLSCNHCEKAPCAAACPTEALVKRPDGIVIHRAERCMGCRYCQMACPYEAPQWEPAKGVISKCHLCHERLDAGREPACVETCFAGALQLLRLDDAADALPRETPGLIHLPGARPTLRVPQHPPTPFPPPVLPSPQPPVEP